ncbi:DUF1772 domain-containing protein [Kibdelosporangium phytohabitans]|uniref:DUF1772 domain-containing protein n=1 Tax=Kibdelosporangium phytohabitans TaxID=860235 RepID=A0A0N9I4V6_9PSEU|nr:DUF1772 domain-containing protein [Kibdelosporangium phytohabitans]ALG10906.1 hypothetical protein AOZ06_32065 [Kibdelosporangium phytohabitans]MBE1462097.1 putative membrane protein [Kibdelosporangium phytohabitans]
MVVSTLGVLAVLGSGVTAGVLFAVALSVLPALFRMPPDRYVYSHKLIGRNWDPTMPLIVLGSTALDIALVFLVPGGTPRLIAVVGAVLMLGVSAVSHLCNVPINRQVKKTDPANVPVDWRDPRPLWRRWHLLRTVLAIVGLLCNAVLVVLV